MVLTQEEYDAKFKKISEELAVLFHTKNTDYGAAYFKEENAADWHYELKRKYIRLQEIIKNDGPRDAKKETLVDIAVYSIMELIRMGE